MVVEIISSLFAQYGTIGLGLAPFVLSLFFVPGFTELLIPLYLGLGKNPWVVLFAIYFGSMAGTIANYYFGLVGSKLFHQRRKEIEKASIWLNKWGNLSMVVASILPPPFPFDIVTVLVGFLKMDLRYFLISVSIGKLIKYGILIFGIEQLFLKFPYLLGGL